MEKMGKGDGVDGKGLDGPKSTTFGEFVDVESRGGKGASHKYEGPNAGPPVDSSKSKAKR